MKIFINLFFPTRSNDYKPRIGRSTLIFALAALMMFSNFTLSGKGKVFGASGIDGNELIVLHNRERRARGFPPLTKNIQLTRAAQAKADAMLASDCWAHYCPDGKSPWEFFDSAGYTYLYAGENLAQGFFDNESVINAWMNSPTHRENMLKEEFREVGIGIAYGKFQGVEENIVVTVHFGTRNSNSEIQQIVTGQSGTPTISFPSEGEYTNDKNIPIIGEVSSSDTVDVFINSESKGKVSVEGGIFTYRGDSAYKDGKYTALVRTADTKKNSDPRTFFVDTKNPAIIKSSIEAQPSVSGEKGAISLIIKSEEPLSFAKAIFSDEEEVTFQIISSLEWQADLDIDLVNNFEGFKIEYEDLAGNKSQENYNFEQVKGLSQALDASENISSGAFLFNPFISLIKKFSGSNLAYQVNLILILTSIGIIGVDFWALKKTGFTTFKGKPHLHLTSLVILVLIIIVGGSKGFILNGVGS